MVKISNLQELLSPAYEHEFAILACNVRHSLIMEACLDAAFQARAPLIMQLSESEYHYCDWSFVDFVAEAQKNIEILIHKYNYQIPIGIHLDHLQKDETLIDQALDAGFRSVLLDLSALSDEENRKRCGVAIKKVHARDCSMEVEQGAIGFAKDLPHTVEEIEKLYTTVEQATVMVEGVHPDALAIAVGNGHGTYIETPHIGFDRIKEIAGVLKPYKTPLVLHGGSGLKNLFQQAVASGINKVNYATELSNILFACIPESLLKNMQLSADQQKTDLRKVIGQYKDAIKQMPKENKTKLYQSIVKDLLGVLDILKSSNKISLYIDK